jgi:hypothetical protein
MATVFDRETLDRFRTLTPRQAFEEAKTAVYRAGAAGSDDFLDVYEELVAQGILTQEQIEEFTA